jgi:GNAT superfamily N-acetyltransferase
VSAPAPAARRIVHVPPHVFEAPRGRYRIRAARPDDEEGLRRMLEAAAPDDIRLRFFRHIRTFPHEFIEPLTQSDDCCHFAFVATADTPEAPVVGSAMMVADTDRRAAEFGIFVARAAAGQRLGSHLLDCLIREARGHGFDSIYGLIMLQNRNMIDLARRLGFVTTEVSEEPGCVRADLRLVAAAAAAATQ